MSDVTLSDLKAFAAVARLRSFRRAADEQGVSRSSLSHALRSLEGRLGVRLLHRTTRSVALTQAGRDMLERLAPMLRELDDLVDAISHGTEELVGGLRINSNVSGARWLLRRAAPAFLERHPRVALDLVADGRLVDIVAEGFDAGVRLAESVPQDMVAVPFGGEARFVAVAAPAYVETFGRPSVPDDLARHRCIRQRLPSGKPYRWEFSRGGREVLIDPPGPLCLDDNGLMVEAAIIGLGVAFVPEVHAVEALATGRLTLLLDEWSPPIPGLCLYYAGHRQVPAALRAFIEIVRKVDQNARKAA